jgi:hypothetical protein
MGWLYSNPASSANKYLKQIPGAVTPYFQPYINAGNKAMGALNNQYTNLLGLGNGLEDEYSNIAQDPAAAMNKVGSSYQQSPGYQWQLDQGLNAESNRADAGGYAGNPQDQQEASYVAEQQANQDYYNYLGHALNVGKFGLEGETGLYNEGLHGTEHINNMGYDASQELASAIAQTLMAQANLSYSGMANQNEHRGNLLAGGVTIAHNLMHPKAKNYVSPVTHQPMPQSGGSSSGGIAGLVGKILSHL